MGSVRHSYDSRRAKLMEWIPAFENVYEAVDWV